MGCGSSTPAATEAPAPTSSKSASSAPAHVPAAPAPAPAPATKPKATPAAKPAPIPKAAPTPVQTQATESTIDKSSFPPPSKTVEIKTEIPEPKAPEPAPAPVLVGKQTKIQKPDGTTVVEPGIEPADAPKSYPATTGAVKKGWAPPKKYKYADGPKVTKVNKPTITETVEDEWDKEGNLTRKTTKLIAELGGKRRKEISVEKIPAAEAAKYRD